MGHPYCVFVYLCICVLYLCICVFASYFIVFLVGGHKSSVSWDTYIVYLCICEFVFLCIYVFVRLCICVKGYCKESG